MLDSAPVNQRSPSETFLMTQDETRKCLHCGKIKPLTAEHFQIIRFFVKGFSFYCNACDSESKKKDAP